MSRTPTKVCSFGADVIRTMNTSILSDTGFRITTWRDKGLKAYQARYEQDDLRELRDDRVAEVLQAQGFIAPEAPRSVYRVEKLYQALSKYAPGTVSDPHKVFDLEAGFTFARICFCRDRKLEVLQPLTLDEEGVNQLTKNWSGSAGLTALGKRKRDATSTALEKAKRILKQDLAPEPCIAYKRTQFNDKTRLVWGYPYSMTILEGLLAQPLINEMKRGMTPMAFAMPTGVLGAKLRTSAYNKEWAYSMDMSSYDATIAKSLIEYAFWIISTWFDLDQEILDGWKVRDLLDRIQHYFIFTPIVMPDGCCYKGKQHGVPSGSYFTQLVDSIVNCIIAGAISNHFGMRIKRTHTYVLGDDLLMWSNKKVDLDEIAQYAKSELGVIMHGSEKSMRAHFDEPIHFLGRDWYGGVPTLATDEILKRMVYPESFRQYSDDPEKARKQVKLLILSYAAVYREAWMIAQRVYGDSDSNFVGSEKIECDVYCQGVMLEILQERADKLSGLLRFQARYFDRTGNAITTTAQQFWL